MNKILKHNLYWLSGLSLGFGMGFLIGKVGIGLILFAAAFILVGFLLNLMVDKK